MAKGDHRERKEVKKPGKKLSIKEKRQAKREQK